MAHITPAHVRARKFYTPSETGCWEWQGKRNSNGYGVIRAGGANHLYLRAHRVIYEDLIGPIPDGMHLCHTCDNPPCVNPAHLFPGTDGDNMRDKTRKGRNYSPPKIIDAATALNIYADLATATMTTGDHGTPKRKKGTFPALAAKYGLTVDQVRYIAKRDITHWAHA